MARKPYVTLFKIMIGEQLTRKENKTLLRWAAENGQRQYLVTKVKGGHVAAKNIQVYARCDSRKIYRETVFKINAQQSKENLLQMQV